MNGLGGWLSVAKFQVGNGIDKYIKQLTNLEFQSEDVVGHAIYQGAAVVADAVKSSIRALPASACNRLEKAALIDGMGIAPMKNEDGYFNVKIGFDGYDSIKTTKFPRGRPISMIARSIESGTSWRPKHPFVAPAVNKTKALAEMAMAAEIDKRIRTIVS